MWHRLKLQLTNKSNAVISTVQLELYWHGDCCADYQHKGDAAATFRGGAGEFAIAWIVTREWYITRLPSTHGQLASLSVCLSVCLFVCLPLSVNMFVCVFLFSVLHSVLRRCWLDSWKSIPPVRNRVMKCWLLFLCSKVQMIGIWSSWCHCHPIICCFITIWFSSPFWCHLLEFWKSSC